MVTSAPIRAQHVGESQVALQRVRPEPRDGDAAAGERGRGQEVARRRGVRLDQVVGGDVGPGGHEVGVAVALDVDAEALASSPG